MTKILEHQEANGQASQGARQMRNIGYLGTLGKCRRSATIKVLRIESIAQIARDYKERAK